MIDQSDNSVFYKSYTLVQKAQIDTFLRLMRDGQHITSVWMPGQGRTETIKMFCSNKEFRSLFSSELAKFALVPIDMGIDNSFFDKHLGDSLGMFSVKESIIDKIADISGKKQIVLLLDNFKLKDIDKFSYLKSLSLHSSTDLLFWSFMLNSDFADISASNAADTALLHNIIRIPYLNNAAATQWIQHNQTRHGLKLSQTEIAHIVEFSGGVPAILRACLRQYSQGSDYHHSDEIALLLNNLLHRFSDKEQLIMHRLKLTGTLPPHKVDIEHLVLHNALSADYKLIGNWHDLVIKIKESVEIVVDEDKILWEGINIEEALSANEKKILRQILQSKTQLITREDIAANLWGNDSYTKYSDWAIDQMVSRLRKKLQTLGIKPQIIKTVKGKGFVAQNVELR